MLCPYYATVDQCLKVPIEYDKMMKISVADPDPDPVLLGHPDPGKYRIRILYLQKDPYNSNFLIK